MRNFIVLIGGPGRFQSCDKEHDQAWSNYIVPPQLAAMHNSYHMAPDETIHWAVYTPPYEHRWADDDTITKDEKKQSDDAWLHSTRKKAAQKVRQKGARNYLHRIQMMAAEYNFKYKEINTPRDFWDYLASFPRESISRVWYFGHASGAGLMLVLTHEAPCTPGAERKDMIYTEKLIDQSHLADRFDPKTKQASRFYGCFTNNFAQKWHEVFKVPTEGADQKIDFGSVDRPSNIPCILERLQKTPTSKGDPKWTTHE